MKIDVKMGIIAGIIFLLCACGNTNVDSAEYISQREVDVQKQEPATSDLHKQQIECPEEPRVIDKTEENFETDESVHLIFPNPTSDMVGLSGLDAVLFDASISDLDRTPDNSICIPVIGVYGEYEDSNGIALVCSVQYHYFYGYSGSGCKMDKGGQHRVAKATLQKNKNGEFVCESFILSPYSGSHWIDEFCGPLTELKRHFRGEIEWEIETTMPAVDELLDNYLSSIELFIGDCATEY